MSRCDGDEAVGKLAEEIAASVSIISKSAVVTTIPVINNPTETVSNLREDLKNEVLKSFENFCINYKLKEKLDKLKTLQPKPANTQSQHVTCSQFINHVKLKHLKAKKQLLEEKIAEQSNKIKELEQTLEPQFKSLEKQINTPIVRHLRSHLESIIP